MFLQRADLASVHLYLHWRSVQVVRVRLQCRGWHGNVLLLTNRHLMHSDTACLTSWILIDMLLLHSFTKNQGKNMLACKDCDFIWCALKCILFSSKNKMGLIQFDHWPEYLGEYFYELCELRIFIWRCIKITQHCGDWEMFSLKLLVLESANVHFPTKVYQCQQHLRWEKKQYQILVSFC